MLARMGPQALLTTQCDLAGALLPVEFTLFAPDAREVYLIGEMTDWLKGKLPMQREPDGHWRIRMNLRRGQWLYKFEVDGQWIADPANALRAEDGMGIGEWQSCRFVGEGDWTEYPHHAPGKVIEWSLPSRRLGRRVPVAVYLPPDSEKQSAYPYLVLLHGHQVTTNQWPTNGRIKAYMDNLLAQGSIEPFAVVMPSGHNGVDMMRYGHFVSEELLPALPEAFPLRREAAARAVAGMSIQRFGPLALAIDHPDAFGLVAPINENLADHVMLEAERIGDYPFRMQLYCTLQGCAYPRYEVFAQTARQAGAPINYMRIAGEPTWRNWNNLTRELLMVASEFFHAPNDKR